MIGLNKFLGVDVPSNNIFITPFIAKRVVNNQSQITINGLINCHKLLMSTHRIYTKQFKIKPDEPDLIEEMNLCFNLGCQLFEIICERFENDRKIEEPQHFKTQLDADLNEIALQIDFLVHRGEADSDMAKKVIHKICHVIYKLHGEKGYPK